MFRVRCIRTDGFDGTLPDFYASRTCAAVSCESMNATAHATVVPLGHQAPGRLTARAGGDDERALDALSFSDILVLVVSETGVVEQASGSFMPAAQNSYASPLWNHSVFDALSPIPSETLGAGLAHALVGEYAEAEAVLAGLPCFITFSPMEGLHRCMVTVWPGMGSDQGVGLVTARVELPESCDVGRVARWLRPGLNSLVAGQTELSLWIEPSVHPTTISEPSVSRLIVSLVDALRLLTRNVPRTLLSVSQAPTTVGDRHHESVAVRVRASTGYGLTEDEFESLHKHCTGIARTIGLRVVTTEAEDGIAMTALLPSPHPERTGRSTAKGQPDEPLLVETI